MNKDFCLKSVFVSFMLLGCGSSLLAQVRKEILLQDNWKFSQTDASSQSSVDFDDSKWKTVSVPHDWAVSGPFDKKIDMQVVAIEQNGEKIPTEKTGRTGSLPWIGHGWYRTKFSVPDEYGRAILLFDGAMAEPVVYVNGQKAGEWKYGYNSFYIDVTPFVNKDGKENTLAVRLNNVKESSRWYPGAGLYRPVKLIMTGKTAFDVWGVNVKTASVDSEGNAIIDVFADVEGYKGKNLNVEYKVTEYGGRASKILAGAGSSRVFSNGTANTSIEITDARLWSPETPNLYALNLSLVEIADDGTKKVLDEQMVKFGIRTISFDQKNGFMLNGKTRKFQGVCLHHDLGMLGTAVNKSALARQIKLLKSMGCDAIRTSHNMPSKWQIELCDSLGMMVMAESFDEWKRAKCRNGYNRFFNEWVEKDLTNLVMNYRIHPSIVMWSIGNEIPEQGVKDGGRIAYRLKKIVHSLDDTRPVTAGINGVGASINTGFAYALDIPGLNYHTGDYKMVYEKMDKGFVLGSETASTVSSRGVYKFPVVKENMKKYDDGQCSSYDLEACSWSNIPEYDWFLQDDQPWVIGEFVWTGFDYLGEPTPYDEYWPSRSSYFGIFDLAGLPKDRYYLYRSRWNKEQATIHLLPHWTWPGREGEVTPVYCYTNYPTAELFVNGKSQGKISKNPAELLDRYRLRWNDVKYEPGELKVVVYDENGKEAGQQIVRTAGKPHHIELFADHGVEGAPASLSSMSATDDPSCFPVSEPIIADGQDIVFVTARVVDKNGVVCPEASNQLNFKVKGNGFFRGVCNGDATSLEVFTEPTMKAFKGALVVGVQTTTEPGDIVLTVSGKGLKSASLKLKSK